MTVHAIPAWPLQCYLMMAFADAVAVLEDGHQRVKCCSREPRATCNRQRHQCFHSCNKRLTHEQMMHRDHPEMVRRTAITCRQAAVGSDSLILISPSTNSCEPSLAIALCLAAGWQQAHVGFSPPSGCPAPQLRMMFEHTHVCTPHLTTHLHTLHRVTHALRS